MATIGHYPPDAENQTALGSIPGARFTPGVVLSVDGPDPVGPEAAGAVLVLQGALDRDDKAQQFWGRAAVTLRAARESPGFIRFFAFGDGLAHYAVVMWRTHDAAMAFFRSAAHQDAMHELDRTGNQYTHFAGLFRTDRPHDRHVYCETCRTRNTMPRDRCETCGNELVDVFRMKGPEAAQLTPTRL